MMDSQPTGDTELKKLMRIASALPMPRNRVFFRKFSAHCNDAPLTFQLWQFWHLWQFWQSTIQFCLRLGRAAAFIAAVLWLGVCTPAVAQNGPASAQTPPSPPRHVVLFIAGGLRPYSLTSDVGPGMFKLRPPGVDF